MATSEKSPWQQGYEAGLAGKSGPAIPKADSPWDDRRYSSGWSRGLDARVANERVAKRS
jgi:hypothetical protein